jgi:hypothetical protein
MDLAVWLPGALEPMFAGLDDAMISPHGFR